MKTIQQLEKEKDKIEKQLVKLKSEGEKILKELKWRDIPLASKASAILNKKGKWQISTEQFYNGKTYEECQELAKKEGYEIADYPLLQQLRNDGVSFLKDFQVLVPNPDKISESNNYVAGFGANSVRAFLSCNWDPPYACASFGVFVLRKKK